MSGSSSAQGKKGAGQGAAPGARRRPVSLKRLAAFVYDALAVAVAWNAAFLFRFSFEGGAAAPPIGIASIAWVLPLYMLVFIAGGLYRGIWYFASIPDLLRIGKAIAVATLLAVAFAAMGGLVGSIPRSVFVLFPLFLLFLTGGARLAYRAAKDYLLVQQRQPHYGGKPLLVIGAGRSGARLVKELTLESNWRVVGFLDDHRDKIGNEICGVRVLGPIGALSRWAAQLGVRDVVIAIPSASAARRAEILRTCVDAGLHPMSMPTTAELMTGVAKASALREVGLEDLIGRPPVVIDSETVSDLIKGRCVLVTGAGGSIGAELCRQVARFEPASLVLLELSEFALYSIDQSLRESFPEIKVHPLAGDVKDSTLVRQVLREHRPAVVFHAAAYKHVPLMEELNCWQAIRNNVLGTYQMARACVELDVGKFVLISTDKAVNPTNVMGASKRLAELVCLALHAKSPHTRFEVVRFGNVIGSAGSVIPRFQQQIAKGGPVTVTHPEITRFFMSIPEATQLVLQAAAMGRGGEVFVLDMGEPIKVVDVARNLIRLSGLTTEQVKIVFTGLRPGEKLFEELLADNETTRETHHPKLRIAGTQSIDPARLQTIVAWIERRDIPSDEAVRQELMRFLPEYAPTAHRAPLAPVIELRVG